MIHNHLEKFFSSYKENLRLSHNKEPHLEFFLEDLESSFKWTNSNMVVKLIEGKDGSAILMSPKKKSSEAYFGYTTFNNYKNDSNLWKEIIQTCKIMKIKLLRGPVHGTTFFPYRFISRSDGSSFFKGEFFSTKEDHQFMKVHRPKNIITYSSGYRTNFNNVMKISKPYFDKHRNMGLVIKHWKSIDRNLSIELFRIIEIIFAKNWGYNKISKEYFLNLFSFKNKMNPKMFLDTIHLNQKLIGFCNYIENDANTLIFKTIGILPEYQKMGIANAIVYQMHVDAIDSKYTKIIYALVKDDNRVKNMPDPDVTLFRSYASYEFDIC